MALRPVSRITDLRALLDVERCRPRDTDVGSGRRRIGFVPTMGALHDGHLSLVGRAGEEAELVVVSIFVNPLQFAPGEDLDAYPRQLEADLSRCEAAGADVVFAPDVTEMYPGGPPRTTVSVGGASARFEGAARPTHFAGVATVVTKLLSIVGACRAVFGEKDYQQLVVVRRLVADLSLPVEVVGAPTVREPDGLAMSSRNVHLDPAHRAAAPVLHEALVRGRELVVAGECDRVAVEAAMAELIDAEPLVGLDYVAVVDADTLETPAAMTGRLRLLGAMRCGATRLLDNIGVSAR